MGQPIELWDGTGFQKVKGDADGHLQVETGGGVGTATIYNKGR